MRCIESINCKPAAVFCTCTLAWPVVWHSSPTTACSHASPDPRTTNLVAILDGQTLQEIPQAIVSQRLHYPCHSRTLRQSAASMVSNQAGDLQGTACSEPVECALRSIAHYCSTTVDGVLHSS